MRTLLVGVALVTGVATALSAQTPTRLSLSFEADSVTVRPANGYDGVVREGKADNVLTATGNVVLFINDIRMTADSATWHWDSMEVTLGSALVHLPTVPTGIRYAVRRR